MERKTNNPPKPIPNTLGCNSVIQHPILLSGRFPGSLTLRKFWSASCTVAVGGVSNSADTVLFSSQPRWATCGEKRATCREKRATWPAQSLGAAPAPRRKSNPSAVLEYSHGVAKSHCRIQPDLLSLVPSQLLLFHDLDGPKSLGWSQIPTCKAAATPVPSCALPSTSLNLPQEPEISWERQPKAFPPDHHKII